MMSIRSKLLTLLLPPLIAFISMISLFFYYNWQKEIIGTFKERLLSTVESISVTMPEKTVQVLKQSRNKDKQLIHDFKAIIDKIGLSSLYIVHIVPVNKGEPVLLHQPISETNPIYDGKDPSLAFRQIYLLDVSSKQERASGEEDFSESGEQLIYLSKRPLVTDQYYSRFVQEHIITAYAPILDAQGQVIALLGADVSMESVSQKLRAAAIVIALSSLAIIGLVILSVFLSAHHISLPVQQIKSSALNIAAGEYGSTVSVKGPLEITELANTLNTMSECLKENIERLRQSAITRERLYGEYECAVLLQEWMFKKPIQELKHPSFKVHGLQTQVALEPHGVYVSFKDSTNERLQLEFKENLEFGFKGVFNLLKEVSEASSAFPTIRLEASEDGRVNYEQQKSLGLFLWQKEKLHLLSQDKGEFTIFPGDIMFIASLSLTSLFPSSEELSVLFSKVLKHFARDSFQTMVSMLQQELHFISNNYHLERDGYLIAVSYLPV